MPKSVAVIVEWENVLLSDLGRARQSLRRLREQALDYARERATSFELIVAYNPDDICVSVPQSAISDEIDAGQWPGTIRMLPTPGLHYYEQKNFGATRTEAEVLVFLDSDVIPDDGWLRCLLDAVDDPCNVVVGGETYMSRDTFADRAFATFWFFNPPLNRTGVNDDSSFYANNVAFKRGFFLAHRFPDADCYRGQCTHLCKSILQEGFAIKRHGGARVSHPAPRGLKHIVARAICHGYDTVYWLRREQFGAIKASPAGALFRFARSSLGLVTLIPSRAKQLGTHPLTAVAAAAVAVCFNVVILGAETVAYFTPRVIRSHVRI